MGVLHSFSIKNIFHDKMDLRIFYFRVMICFQGTSFEVIQELKAT